MISLQSSEADPSRDSCLMPCNSNRLFLLMRFSLVDQRATEHHVISLFANRLSRICCPENHQLVHSPFFQSVKSCSRVDKNLNLISNAVTICHRFPWWRHVCGEDWRLEKYKNTKIVLSSCQPRASRLKHFSIFVTIKLRMISTKHEAKNIFHFLG